MSSGPEVQCLEPSHATETLPLQGCLYPILVKRRALPNFACRLLCSASPVSADALLSASATYVGHGDRTSQTLDGELRNLYKLSPTQPLIPRTQVLPSLSSISRVNLTTRSSTNQVTMLARTFTALLATSLLLVASAAPAPGGQNQQVSQCSSGPVQCCNQALEAESAKKDKHHGGIIAALLNVVNEPTTALVGINCTPLNVLALGGNTWYGTCLSSMLELRLKLYFSTQQTVCCNNNSFSKSFLLSPLMVLS